MAKVFAAAPNRKMGTLFGTGHLKLAEKQAAAKEARAQKAEPAPTPKPAIPAPRKLSERVAARNRSSH